MTTISPTVPLDYQTPHASTESKGMLWTGRVISGLVVLFMLFDGAIKVARIPAVMEMSKQMGFTEGTIVGIGIACLVSAIIYAIPQTAILGAILLTGYLGGAIAINVFLKQPLFNWFFAFTFGVLTWLGIYLHQDWNSVHIIARGNTMIHMLNGHVMSILIDDDEKNRTMDGQLGVQVHVGGPMKVEYKSIRLKKL